MELSGSGFYPRKETVMSRILGAALLSSLLLAAGCKAKMDNHDAIRDGVLKHLAGMNGLNVNNMSVVVTNASVNGDKAQADVEIRVKNGDPAAPAMKLSYELQKQGEAWVVVKGQPTGGMEHPVAGQMPLQGAMPAGHPPVNGATGQIPANHPDFNSILNSTQPPPQTQPQGTSQQPAQQPSSMAKP
jgi:hypothetical protein